MKRIIFPLALLLLTACHTKQDQITQQEDYNNYLASNQTKTTSRFFELWNSKIKPDSLQLLSFGNVASEYNRYFKETGDITFLKQAEKALTKAVEIANINKEGYLRALARNYISQHRFKEALSLAEEALALKGGKKETHSLLFDVHMELGNYSKAEAYLDSIRNPSEFGYLIRIAKWNDHIGDLETTIRFMEKAMQKAESSKNKGLRIWSYSNIADYYGHAGKIKESYENYLKTLRLDPYNAYAKKGIAWIVFSHEKNPDEALRILNAVTEKYGAPDYFLLKAEISDFLDDSSGFTQNMDAFYKKAEDKNYGEMYNSHKVHFYLDHTRDTDRALQLALKEVQNRPTPESYNLLAATYLKMQKYKNALTVVEKQIAGKTFEPAILLNAAKVYKANNRLDKVNEIKPELISAVYELGPSSVATIAKL
ncbi:tetratricopeptide repeat protein [uncultured Croceitalea sp.]|uniref:tetratricopeptide repeat protein n=1 Tax=uncultured Croceitalea sp. TaxID=1798908 RepID=UPI003305EDB2